MDRLKQLLGLVWMALAAITFVILVVAAAQNIDAAGTKEINKPIPWIIIITIFTPIAVGMAIFGWYAWKGEYKR